MMSPTNLSWPTFVASLAAALIVAGFGAWLTRRRTDAETSDIITQASERVVRMMQTQIDGLQAEVQTLRAEVAASQAERAALNTRLAQTEQRERDALNRIGELETELSALRLRVARYETPITAPPAASTTTTTVVYQPTEES